MQRVTIQTRSARFVSSVVAGGVGVHGIDVVHALTSIVFGLAIRVCARSIDGALDGTVVEPIRVYVYRCDKHHTHTHTHTRRRVSRSLQSRRRSDVTG